MKALTAEQAAALLAEIPERHRLIFRFLLETGLRIGEATEVRYRDLDLGGRFLSVDRQFARGKVTAPKRIKKRRVPLSEAMAQDLWNLRKETRAGDEDLVFTANGGVRINQSNLSRILKPAAVRAGLGWVKEPGRRHCAKSWVTFHSFRHSCATTLFRAGWNAVQAATSSDTVTPASRCAPTFTCYPKTYPLPMQPSPSWATPQPRKQGNK